MKTFKNNNNDGYIKFKCNFKKSDFIAFKEIKELNFYRKKLLTKGFIGIDSENVSYGNVSQKIDTKTFIITGSNTGGIGNLKSEHYSKVIDWDIENNSVFCEGSVKASSETLSHAAIYEKLPDVNAVIHIHDNYFWKKFIDKLPTAKKSAAYGTVELAKEIQFLLEDDLIKKEQVIIMGGHEDGIIFFGRTLKEAFNKISLKLKAINS